MGSYGFPKYWRLELEFGDAMDRRFFLNRPPAPNDAFVSISGPEAKHVAQVLRARVGDEAVLFDGTGVEYRARITELGKAEVRFEILRRAAIDRELPFLLHAGVALPKGDRQKDVVEKAVETGVTRLTPVSARYSVAEVDARVVDRLRRYAIEASKQSGRNRLLDVGPPRSFGAFVAQAPSDAVRWFAHPGGPPIDAEEAVRIRGATEVWFAIGPEGGWSESEYSSAIGAGWRPIGLGPRVLRVETAVCACAVLAAVLRDPP
ncbi:MAG: 16S rRNA (uracil(1498)-N(3))-methyltransferase [Planctomycetes bacterium]|nr:16S rRNA (uracil(1498)-N(3))-methyltransferase [Planctomycetota bacterium]